MQPIKSLAAGALRAVRAAGYLEVEGAGIAVRTFHRAADGTLVTTCSIGSRTKLSSTMPRKAGCSSSSRSGAWPRFPPSAPAHGSRRSPTCSDRRYTMCSRAIRLCRWFCCNCEFSGTSEVLTRCSPSGGEHGVPDLWCRRATNAQSTERKLILANPMQQLNAGNRDRRMSEVL